jgi:DNA polymerase III epsilon subunit-like protein
MTSSDPKKIEHLYAVLFRESKIIISNYEKYLNEKISSKELAQKMLSLRDAVLRIEDSNK